MWILALKREHGIGVKQVEAITMEECRNACKFGDPNSVRGVSACAAFALGALLGGRRPRSLTTVKLKDLFIWASEVEVDDARYNVPAMTVRFVQEKFDDLQGPRRATDQPHCDKYDVQISCSAAFWIYRLLVIRGCLVGDPIWDAQPGEARSVPADCAEYYLFCDCTANMWIDTLPVSTDVLGDWNKYCLKE